MHKHEVRAASGHSTENGAGWWALQLRRNGKTDPSTHGDAGSSVAEMRKREGEGGYAFSSPRSEKSALRITSHAKRSPIRDLSTPCCDTPSLRVTFHPVRPLWRPWAEASLEEAADWTARVGGSQFLWSTAGAEPLDETLERGMSDSLPASALLTSPLPASVDCLILQRRSRISHICECEGLIQANEGLVRPT